MQKRHSNHWHCFSGDLDGANVWVDLFLNCCFGLLPIFDQRCQARDIIHHFVLESNSPYLSYRKGTAYVIMSWFMRWVKKVSLVLLESLEQVFSRAAARYINMHCKKKFSELECRLYCRS